MSKNQTRNYRTLLVDGAICELIKIPPTLKKLVRGGGALTVLSIIFNFFFVSVRVSDPDPAGFGCFCRIRNFKKSWIWIRNFKKPGSGSGSVFWNAWISMKNYQKLLHQNHIWAIKLQKCWNYFSVGSGSVFFKEPGSGSRIFKRPGSGSGQTDPDPKPWFLWIRMNAGLPYMKSGSAYLYVD